MTTTTLIAINAVLSLASILAVFAIVRATHRPVAGAEIPDAVPVPTLAADQSLADAA